MYDDDMMGIRVLFFKKTTGLRDSAGNCHGIGGSWQAIASHRACIAQGGVQFSSEEINEADQVLSICAC